MTAAWIHAAAYSAAAALLLTWGGNWSCRLLLSKFKIAALPQQQQIAPEDGPSSQALSPMLTEPAFGRLIGTLERALIAAGIVFASWEILVAVIALKTVARFKDLDERIHAEYFLVGSLFSIAWALLITGAWIGYDRFLGMELRHLIGAEELSAPVCAANCLR
jgi:hypothetical protein